LFAYYAMRKCSSSRPIIFPRIPPRIDIPNNGKRVMEIENTPNNVNAPIDWMSVVCSENGDVQFQLVNQTSAICMNSMEIVKIHYLMKKAVVRYPHLSVSISGNATPLQCDDNSVKNLRLVPITIARLAPATAERQEAAVSDVRSTKGESGQ
jgi:hypothetical protein